MRRLLFAGLLCGLAAPSLADPAVTVAPATMRASASPRASVVQRVPANAQVDIRSCRAGWCWGSWRGLYGFLPAFAVAGDAPPPGAAPLPPPVAFAPPPPPLVVTAPVVVAPPPPPPPVWGGPYVGVGWGWSRW